MATVIINPLLQEERNKATFPVRDMSTLWYGGEENLQRWERVRKIVEDDPIFRHGLFI